MFEVGTVVVSTRSKGLYRARAYEVTEQDDRVLELRELMWHEFMRKVTEVTKWGGIGEPNVTTTLARRFQKPLPGKPARAKPARTGMFKRNRLHMPGVQMHDGTKDGEWAFPWDKSVAYPVGFGRMTEGSEG